MKISIDKIAVSAAGKPRSLDFELHPFIASYCGVRPDDIIDYTIVKRSIDARQRPDVKLLYSLVVELGADRPRYDEAILGYIDRVQDPVRFEIEKTGGGDPFCIIGGADGPTAIWLTTNGGIIPFVSVIVFVVLGLICIRLIKSTNPPKDSK